MKRAEITLMVLLAAFAASLTIGATDLKYSDEYSFGPGFVPLSIGVLLLACCALQGLRVWKRESAGDGAAEKPDLAGLALAVAIIVAGIAAMSFGSVLAPIAAIVLLLSWLVSKHTLAMSAMVSVTTTAAIYVIFSIWLGLPVG